MSQQSDDQSKFLQSSCDFLTTPPAEDKVKYAIKIGFSQNGAGHLTQWFEMPQENQNFFFHPSAKAELAKINENTTKIQAESIFKTLLTILQQALFEHQHPLQPKQAIIQAIGQENFSRLCKEFGQENIAKYLLVSCAFAHYQKVDHEKLFLNPILDYWHDYMKDLDISTLAPKKVTPKKIEKVKVEMHRWFCPTLTTQQQELAQLSKLLTMLHRELLNNDEKEISSQIKNELISLRQNIETQINIEEKALLVIKFQTLKCVCQASLLLLGNTPNQEAFKAEYVQFPEHPDATPSCQKLKNKETSIAVLNASFSETIEKINHCISNPAQQNIDELKKITEKTKENCDNARQAIKQQGHRDNFWKVIDKLFGWLVPVASASEKRVKSVEKYVSQLKTIGCH